LPQRRAIHGAGSLKRKELKKKEWKNSPAIP
jgi:hypothetical protein